MWSIITVYDGMWCKLPICEGMWFDKMSDTSISCGLISCKKMRHKISCRDSRSWCTAKHLDILRHDATSNEMKEWHLAQKPCKWPDVKSFIKPTPRGLRSHCAKPTCSGDRLCAWPRWPRLLQDLCGLCVSGVFVAGGTSPRGFGAFGPIYWYDSLYVA